MRNGFDEVIGYVVVRVFVAENYKLVSVFLPTSLVAISEGTFKYCRVLQRVIIPT